MKHYTKEELNTVSMETRMAIEKEFRSYDVDYFWKEFAKRLE